MDHHFAEFSEGGLIQKESLYGRLTNELVLTVFYLAVSMFRNLERLKHCYVI
jgi:hypothetical protein